ncbi:hypothetical protein BDV32DRAFT_154361 [Aspergillus pseudonomiae]|uniref:Uncharacterized protein n=1 Tax=Aspergillus pseudonomiae TaxID=1506151 RepID=A0A5N7CYJ3_9EURO|nr:uncharacterized protein BDV37DRAFT_287946 [Aspergillus pseudonomiae]KAB8255330.1 hypothetical protein BDV32DRAFT_154361 [Aspergillus pseudonomiae]KAE8399039.1 hypothetical protein BDV37DRAFT_287946 [Aspergillus pseudonomiae]
MAYTAGIVASLARETNESLEVLCETQINEAIISGLTWSRRVATLHFPQRGDGKEPTLQDMKYDTAPDPILLSLNTTISERAASGEPARVSLFDCLPYGNVYDKTPSANLLLTSDDIVTNGPRNVLPYVPNASFGALRTADRTEIDGFRRIANEIRGYVEKIQTGPLNLAVFGQPGSGKSFGIKQLIRTILKSHEQTGAEFVFNLSQLENKEPLHSVFDTIRDQSFTKNIPVVFFDEFDSIFNGLALGWLNEFPAPFGTYPHKLGRGIHVYIGGKSTQAPDIQRKTRNSQAHGTGTIKSFGGSKGGFPASLNNVVYLEVLLKELCSYGELVEQFHCIRNHVLDGKTPIVIFKDFNTNLGDGILGWVKYFLSPMQDAEFFVDGHDRHIGRAVFVFIERDSGRLAGFPDTTKFSEVVKRSKGPDFGIVEKYLAGNRIAAKPLSIGVMKPPSSCSKQGTEDSPPAVKEAVDVRQKFVDEIEKSTDGTSKQDGYVGIIGPNKVDDADRMFYIRRAILLYSMAEVKNLEVEGELRQALLGVPTLRHGPALWRQF